MLLPTSIVLSEMVLKIKGAKSFVSTTYIAKFADGSEKILNRKSWTLTTLSSAYSAVSSIATEAVLDKNCTLYYKDWSLNPAFGTWESNYPK